MHRKLIFGLLALALTGGVASADSRRSDRSYRTQQDQHRAQRSDTHQRRDAHHAPRWQQAPQHHRAHQPVTHRHFDQHHRPTAIAETHEYGTGYTWMPGQWTWNGYEWIWQPGYYQVERAHTHHVHPGTGT